MHIQAEIDPQAMSYLKAIVIHRLYETDPIWWQEFLDELKADRNIAGATFRGQVLGRAIRIVEHAVKPESAAARDGK